jgi:hypothetical protein
MIQRTELATADFGALIGEIGGDPLVKSVNRLDKAQAMEITDYIRAGCTPGIARQLTAQR